MSRAIEMDQLQALTDRQAIADLLHHYCWCVDHQETDRLLTEFYTADAVDDHGQAGTAHGREALRRMFNGLRQWSEAHVHVLSNIQVNLAADGERATTSSIFTAYHWLREQAHRGSRRPADLVSIGCYEDRLRRISIGWRVEARRVTTTAPSFIALGGFPAALERGT